MMARLSEAEFKATFDAPMQRVGMDEGPPFDFWPYVDAIPAEDFEGHDCSPGSVTYAYRDESGRYQHVLIDSEARDVFMAVVLDLRAERVVGHHLLDLPKLYGPDGESEEPA